MKVGLLLLIIVSLPAFILCNSAYPFDTSNPPRFVSEVWFAENGHLMAEFAAYALPAGDSVRIYLTRDFHDYGSLYNYDFNFQIPQDALPLNIPVPTYDNPQVVDVTALLPEISLDAEHDSICFVLVDYSVDNYGTIWNHVLRWSNELGSKGNVLSPLQQGQSYVWCNPGSWIFQWVKDEPPTPGTNIYNAVARSFLKVKVTDQDNNPVPYVSCYCNQIPPVFVTDSNGEYSGDIYPGWEALLFKHPITNTIIGNQYYQYYWVEPFDTLEVAFQIDMPAAYPYTEYRGLQAYPKPANINARPYIKIRYYGEFDARKDSYIKIYDIKGRYIEKIWFFAKGFSLWYPAGNIASGIYLAQMINGNRILDTTTIIITK